MITNNSQEILTIYLKTLMKNLTFLKLFVTTMFVMATALFAGCVDDNDDTEAPRLEVSPKTLVFDTDGTPVEGSQSYFEISANRHWTATVLDDKTWVTLSKMEGDGSDKVQVSIPEGITDEAKVLIQISNKVGVLMKEEVTIRSGNIVPAVVIYNETFGTTAPSKSPYPFVDEFTDWVKSGEGSTTVEYAGSGASIRQSGKLSAGYEGASGGDKLFFGNNANFIIQKITLKSDQTNLKLGFGGSYSQQITGGYDNEFKPESFHFYLSKDGTTWSNAIQYDYKQADEYWVYVTSNFTLKYPVNTLYIKFAADIASVFAIDDPTLSTGNGGQEIDLGNTDPAVSTAEATQVNGTSATLGGSVVNMDVASATEVGVQYTEYTGDVTNIDWANVAKTKAQEKVSPWTVAVTGLTSGSQYAVRAYATTSTGDIYGSVETFTASAPEAISIADLVTKIKATTEVTPIDNDYIIQGIICGDPEAQNCSYGTLYVMTKGATTAGNALTLYNTTIKPETYSLGDEIKVTLRKESAKMQVYNSAPQISGFDAAEVEKISSGNNVQPVTITVDKLLDFACMPVKIENVTIETAGIWKPEDNKATHTFKANGSDLTVYINKGASSFNNVAYIAKENGSLTGIAAAYKTSAQLLPRNLEDVKEFEATGPTITSVAPSQVNFPSTGGEETLIISTSNQGSSTLQLSPLGEGISAEVIDNNTVKVKAEANTSTNEIKKDLVISLSGGNSVTVPIKVAAIGGSNGYKLIETVADLSEGKYFMAGYAEISNDKTDLKPYTYQIWQGTLSSSDLVTVAYQYQGDELIAKDASQVAAEMELVKIDGKADTYYIKIGDQYLYNPSKATNRKLKLKDTADESVEWKFEDKNNGGVTASNNEVYLVTANADSKFIRSYKSSSISSLKGIFFFKKK
jgi:ribosomal protein S16